MKIPETSRSACLCICPLFLNYFVGRVWTSANLSRQDLDHVRFVRLGLELVNFMLKAKNLNLGLL